MSYPGSFIKYIVTEEGILKVFSPVDPNSVAHVGLMGSNIWAMKMIKDSKLLAIILDESFTISVTSANSFAIIPL